MPALTPNAVGRMLGNDLELRPTVQCIGVKMMVSNTGQSGTNERYRLAISDGQYWCVAMLATQLNSHVKANEIHENTVFKLEEYLSNAVQGKKIIIILGLTILEAGIEGAPNIGSPVQPYPSDGSAPQDQQPVKQEAPQPTPGIYQNGSRPTNPYGNPGSGSGPSGPYSGSGPQNQAPNSSGYSGYGGNPGQHANNGYGQQQQGASAYGQQQPAGLGAYGHQQPGNTYGQQPQQQQQQQQQGGAYGGAYGASRGGGGYSGAAPGYAQPAPDYRAGGSAIARNEAPARIVPISSLNAYQNKWTIKARVSVKGEMRRWNNARGEGRVFSFDVVDSNGGEIKATAFNEAAEKFFELVQQGQVYTISKASLKPKKAQYNNTRHDYEIQLENGTIIKPCNDEQDNIPKALYHFRRIEDIESMPATTMLDIVGILESAGEFATITLKNGRETDKRSIVLRDDSNRSIEITLWGGFASNPGQQLQQLIESGGHPVVAVKTARVGDFNGKTLSTLGTSLVDIDPDIPEAGVLRNWYDNGGGAQQPVQSLSDQRSSGSSRVERRCTLGQINDEQMGANGQPAYPQVLATVNFIRTENLYYPACTGSYNGKQCNKKLTDQGNGWWCERCQAQTAPEYRYMLSVQVCDHTSQEWLTAFQEAGEVIVGMTAAEAKQMEEEDIKTYDAAIQSANFRPLVFNLRVSEDTYNDETRIKKSVNRVAPLDFAKESRNYVDLIRKIERGEPIYQAGQQQTGYSAANAAPPRAGTSYGQGGGGYTSTPTRGGYGGGAGGGNYSGGYNAGGGGYGGGSGTYGGQNQQTMPYGTAPGTQHQQTMQYGSAPANAGYGGGNNGGQGGYAGAQGGYGGYQGRGGQGPAGF